MTCIVGVETDEGVIIGGDALVSTPWNGAPMAYPKVFQSGEFLYGFCGSLRAGQVLQHVFIAPQLPEEDTDEALEKYFVQDWIEHLRSAMLNANIVNTKNDVHITDNAWFLVGVRGRIYCVEEDFAVWRNNRGYQAIGSGEDHALGALAALASDHDLTAYDRVELALEAAAEHANTVGPPFTILELAASE